MRTSFLTTLVLAATFVAGAPLDTRGNPPTFSLCKGGNAQSGNSGNANGGSVYNGGNVIKNGPGASTYPAILTGSR